MATITAQATGNFSATGTWTGGVVPGSGDTAESGNYTVTIDTNITVATLKATGSGYFNTTSGGISITADIVCATTNGAGAFRGAHNSGLVEITGNVTAGSVNNVPAIYMNATGNLTVNGNITAGSGSASYGLLHNSSGTVTVNGDVTGGSGNTADGVRNNSSGTLNINGSATGGSGADANGARNSSTGSMTVTKAIGGGGGPGGIANLAYGVYGSGNSGQVTKVKQTQSGAYGMAAIGGAVFLEEDSANNTAQFRKTANGSTVTLVHASTLDPDFPAEADVRYNVSYANGDKTGAAHIPTAGQVVSGVAVDNTTGTALLTASAVWSYSTRALTDKTGFALTSAYDPAKTAAQEGDAMTLAAGAITAAVIATDAIDGDALAASAVSEIQAGLSTLDASGVRAAVGLATANLDAQLGDLPTNAELTAALGTADDAVLSAIAGLNDLSSGEAQTAAAAALTAYDAATGTDVTAATSGLSTLDAAGVRTAVGLSAANLDTQLDNMPTNSELTAATSGLSTLTAAQVWNYVTRELTSGGGGGGGITAADVWAYATRELTGKTGFSLTSAYDPAKTAAQAGDPMTLATNAVDSNAIAASAVSEIQTGLSTLDAAGVRAAIGLASANLDTQLGDIPTNSELASSLAGLNDVSSGDVQSAAAAALTAYDAATGTDVTSATSGLSTLTAAQVWSYVTRELTSGGGGGGGITAADVWNYATRELTGKTGYELVSAYDAAKNAMQAGSAVTLAPGQLSGLSTLTAQQVWEYVTRTLTSGGGGGSGVTAAEVWEYATRTLTGATRSVEAGMVEGTMLVYRGDTFGVSFTGLGSMTGRSALYVTAKSDTRRGDDEAVFDVKEGVGLTRLNGMAATANWGEVVVSDAATGAMTFRLEATATAALKPGTYQYDIQMTTNSGVTTLGRGSVIVTADVKRATS